MELPERPVWKRMCVSLLLAAERRDAPGVASLLKAIREELLRPRLQWDESHKGTVLNVDPSGRVYSTFEGEVVRWH